MSQRGLDYASVDNNAPPDFPLARRAGVSFTIIRASYAQKDAKGTIRLVPDRHYARDVALARAAGLVVGSYGFFSFDRRAPSAREQVAVYCEAAGMVQPGKDLPPCIDVEFTGRGIADTGRTQREAFAFLLELITEVRRQFGVSPLNYTSHVQWHDTNGLGGPDDPLLDDCPLWIKTPYRLQPRQPLDSVAPREPHIGPATWDPHGYWRVPKPWEDQGYWIQQYQGDAVGCPGFSSTVDVNRFHPMRCTDADAPRLAWVLRRLAKHTTYDSSLRYGSSPRYATSAVEADKQLLALQARNGLVADGIIGVATFAMLCW